MRVQLINAPPRQIVERMYDTPEFTRLALATLAGYLRPHGHEVSCVDAKFERLGYDAVLERVRGFRPDVVGLTAFTNEVKSAGQVAALIKRELPEACTVLGGVHMTAIPERTMDEFPQFDCGVIGEGERTLLELCQALAAGRDLGQVDGLIHRSGGLLTRNGPRQEIADPDSIPMPAWDLMPAAREYTVMTARGCPYSCVFCMNPNGRVVRKRSIEAFVQELEWLIEHKRPERLFICDEIFSVDVARTRRLLDLMIERGVHRKLKWFAQTHVNFVDEELFRRMKEAGAYMVGFGIETGDLEKLKSLNKGIRSHEKIKAAREAARRAGLPVEGYFIIGQPDETYESAQNTIKLAAEVNPDLPIFGIMVPYPGTGVAAMAERGAGGFRIRSYDWDDYNKQIGDALEFEHLSRRQLERLQLIGYLSVFIRNFRFLDLARFLWRFRREGFVFLRKFLFKKATFVNQPAPGAPRREELAYIPEHHSSRR
ncbi:MAG: B12-binding domain-containing radical SAM protein [Planctomycetes bacterium]|nr:B12-binding domain-containing radical SAM protein [Planctomycetota bacterium]